MVTLAQSQQALSNKFGIPTFTVKGDISTIPTNTPVSTINVGVGKFGNLFANPFDFLAVIESGRQSGLSASGINMALSNLQNTAVAQATQQTQDVLLSNLKQGLDAFRSLGQPGSTTPEKTVLTPDKTKSDTTPQGSIHETIDEIKSVLGPTGITLGLVIGGLFVIKSLRN